MDLFPTLPQTLSPRLQWMERHGISTSDHEPNENDNTWTARMEVSSPPITENKWGFGKTEDEALTALAKSAGIRLWNETQD